MADTGGVEIWLVRHGETLWNAQGRITGWSDVPLTERGEAQARALFPLLAADRFDSVVASDLSRAVQTARLAYGEPQRQLPELRELDFGGLEGLPWADLAEPHRVALLAFEGFQAPGGESTARLRSRVYGFFEGLAPGRHLAFTHGGVLRLLLRGPLYGGTDAYFAELNRARLPLAELDGVCFSLNPQVHAFDPLTLRENLAPQETLVRAARRRALGKPVVVSPLTLRPRYNPNATQPQGPLPPDPRQPSLFAAAWTAGSLKYLTLGGAAALTLFETVGAGGVLAQVALPEGQTRFAEGRVRAYPLYHLLAWVGAFAGGEMLPTRSSHPLQVEALALRKGRRMRLILANLSPQPQVVRLEGDALPRELTVRGLDLEGVEEALERPLRFLRRPGHRLVRRGALELPLEPCALLCLDAG